MSGIQMQLAASTSGAAGYAYVVMGGAYTASVRGGTSVSGATALPTQPSNMSSNGMIGVVADGSFIMVSGATCYFTLNNGTSWTGFGGTNATVYVPPGLNGAVAYSSNGGKYAGQLSVVYEYKANAYFCSVPMISRTGSSALASGFSIGSSINLRTLMYSPTLNTFYVTGYGSSASGVRYIDGSSPASGAGSTSVTTSGWNMGVSKDGYPIAPVYQGGVSWSLREYTSADLSSYTSVGGLGFTPNLASPWTWLPTNNTYMIATGGSGSTISIRTSSSGSPTSLSTISSPSVSGVYSFTTMNVMEETTGRIWVTGWATFQDGKGGYFQSPFSIYSDDSGTSWTNSGARFGPSKNFTS